MRILRTYLFSLLAITFLAPTITHAQGDYRVAGDIGFSAGSNIQSLDNYDETSFGAPTQGGVFYNGELGFPSTLGSGSSTASIFGLGSSSYARAILSDAFGFNLNYRFSTSTFAEAVWSDFIVTGPAAEFVPISVNAFLEGSASLSASSSPSPTARLSAGVQLGIFSRFSGGFWNTAFGGTYGKTFSQSAGFDTYSTGLLSDFDGSAAITTPTFNVPVNTPFRIRFQLSTSASAEANLESNFFLEGVASFGNTLTFATNGPAFNLPAGYTINSVEAGIVNNAYVAIPEASTILMSALCVGVIVLGAFARRRSSMAGFSQAAG